MIMLIMLIYAALVVVTFKVIKVKVSPKTVGAAATLGVIVLALILVFWKVSAPTTKRMIVRRQVVEVIPDVREFVSKVHVDFDAHVKKGDPLFDIRSERFVDAVEQATANLEAAKAQVAQLESAVTAADEALAQSKAETAAAKLEYETALAIKADVAGAVADLKVTETQQAYVAAQAADKVAEATLTQQKFALEAAQQNVYVAEAALNTAKFNLSRCTYHSPVDGQVVNWQVAEGVPVMRQRAWGVGTIMDLSDTAVIAVFPQSQLKHVSPGNEVEIAFRRRPGQIATGKVDLVIPYTGEGQLVQTNTLMSAADVGSRGLLAVRIRLDDEELARSLQLGAAGTTAVYSDFGKPFHIITKITIRINAWMSYLPL